MSSGNLRVFLASASVAALAAATPAAAQVVQFNLPSQSLTSAVPEFGRQAKVQILLSAEAAAQRTKPVHGAHDVREALKLMIEGTGLRIASDSGDLITLAASAPAPRPGVVRTAMQAGPATEAAARSVAVGAVETSSVEEVVITASRVERAGFTAPTPTTVVGQTELQQRGTTNIVEILNELPAFRPTNTPQQRTIFGGAGQSNADLRGLGNRRTLVLVDGRRHVGAPVVLATGTVIAVDLNLIPTIMVDRSEVVTGGASAAWGSDAVAGVVNFMTNRTLNGIRTDFSYGQTEFNDAREKRAGIVFGSDLPNDKGHITIGAEFVDQGEAPPMFLSRPWGLNYYATVAATAAERAAGAPALLWSSPVRSCLTTPGGVIRATINAAGTGQTNITHIPQVNR